MEKLSPETRCTFHTYVINVLNKERDIEVGWKILKVVQMNQSCFYLKVYVYFKENVSIFFNCCLFNKNFTTK